MRRLVIAGALALVGVTILALPAVAAELTGGCTLELASADAQGAPLDAGTAPSGTQGTAQDPFQVVWSSTVDYRFSSGATPYQSSVWAIYALGLPIAIARGSDADPLEPVEIGDFTVGGGTPGQLVGTFYVSGFIEGNGGTSRCDGSGWVQLVGDPLGTIPFWVAVVLFFIGGALLIATPYGPPREESAPPVRPREG